jgi:transcription antitermination factor NusG
LPNASETANDRLDAHTDPLEDPADEAARQWYALYTRSHCEQLVCEQLRVKGFQLFLPKIDVWSRRGGLRRLIPAPLFPGYLFLHHMLDNISFIEIRKARGLVRILGQRWDRPGVVSDAEIEAIQRLLHARLPALPHPFLREGQRVRITQGPLTGVEGIFVQGKPAKGLVVLSVELLRRSLAVEVDCTQVVAA